VQHLEFVHQQHFETDYHRVYPTGRLNLFIDFFWQTKFDNLLRSHANGFSDVLFPNLGYTYLVNLGTPFTMHVNDHQVQVKQGGFLPRLNMIEAFHSTGNCLFGIKFKVSPVIFQKKVNFAEYNGTVFPLSYLLDQQIIQQLQTDVSFEQRVELLSNHYEQILDQHQGSLRPIEIVVDILEYINKENAFTVSIEELAANHHISSRTLQRYFEAATGTGSKQALQVLRIRKAIHHIIHTPHSFHYSKYGYYDFSHFYKHLKQFLQKDGFQHLQPHLQLLETLRKKADR
jgi:AraC-like DNA-binding protein